MLRILLIVSLLNLGITQAMNPHMGRRMSRLLAGCLLTLAAALLIAGCTPY